MTTKMLSVLEVENNLFGLIKWIYNKIFEWLVKKINIQYASQSAKIADLKFIGILDIFGFEILTVNSLEQLCINYANELLQQYFNERIFVLEQQEYARQGSFIYAHIHAWSNTRFVVDFVYIIIIIIIIIIIVINIIINVYDYLFT